MIFPSWIRILQLKLMRIYAGPDPQPWSQLTRSRFSSNGFFVRFQIDLRSFVTRLRQLKQRVQQFDRSTRIATQLENQALWLEQMNRVVAEMKLTVRHLKSSVDSLQEHLRFNHSSLRSGHRGSPLAGGFLESDPNS
jgi:hypothetical protein